MPGHDDCHTFIKTGISFINICLIIPLFIIFSGFYRKIPSAFTPGIMALIFALGTYAVTSNQLPVSLPGETFAALIENRSHVK
jgi:tellurite resistance protein TehA-like permease